MSQNECKIIHARLPIAFLFGHSTTIAPVGIAHNGIDFFGCAPVSVLAVTRATRASSIVALGGVAVVALIRTVALVRAVRPIRAVTLAGVRALLHPVLLRGIRLLAVCPQLPCK